MLKDNPVGNITPIVITVLLAVWTVVTVAQIFYVQTVVANVWAET